MAKKLDKIILPFSFEIQKDSVTAVKNTINSMSKTLLGSVGKNFASNIPTELNEALKITNKSIQQATKPVASSKQAVESIRSITSSFEKLNTVIETLKNNLFKLYDSKSATAANEIIAETSAELNKLFSIRDKFSNLISKQRQTGNENKLTGELNSNKNRQKELGSKDSRTEEEIKEIEALIEREKELNAILEEKKKIKIELEKLSKETGYNDISSIDREIDLNTQLNSEATNDTLLDKDYLKIADTLTQLSNVLKAPLEDIKDIEASAADVFDMTKMGLKENDEQAKQFKQTLGEIIGIDISLRGLTSTFKQLIKTSFEFYKSLDKALTDISIVSNMSRSQVQELTSEFIRLSAQTGMAIDDIAQASVIFFQQGLSTDEVMEMTEVTAQFAKVAGSTVEKAADQLTAAVNGFQIGVEGAINVADKLNAVAAKSAASIDEISTAMEKAASQANQAGVSMDKYFAIIATMEEVTREAPENIGTSLKTIMARMQQIKTGENTEDSTDVNDVEKALKTVGIALRDDTGQLKDLEEVLNELGPQWNSLDRNTQAYLGTIIAGTRQQSRFISMMQNWDRVLELTQVSENSAGQQALMHQKAMQGLDAAINTLTNSWQKFLTTLTNSDTFINALKIVSSLLNNISKAGTKVLIPLTLFIASTNKANTVLSKLGLNLKKTVSSAKIFFKDIKNGYNPLKKSSEAQNKLSKELQTAKDRYKMASDNLNRYVYAQKLAVDANFKAKEMTRLATLEKEREDLINNKASLSTERFAKELAKLNNEINRIKDGLQTSTIGVQELDSKIKGATASVDKYGKELDDAEIAYQNSCSTILQLVGVIELLVSAFGGADEAWGQLISIVAAGLGMIYILFQTTHKKLLKNPLYALITLGLVVVTNTISLFKKALDDGTEGLADSKDSFKDLSEEVQNLETTIKGIGEYLDIYDELSKKIIKTTEDQEKLNESIQALSELTGVKYIDNGDGTYYIDQNAVNNALKKQEKELEQKRKEEQSAAADVLKAQTKVNAKADKTLTRDKWIIGLSAVLGGALGTTTAYAVVAKEMEEAKKNARLKAFDETKNTLLEATTTIVDIKSTTDSFGNVTLPASVKSQLETSIRDSLANGYRDRYGDGLSEDKLIEYLDKDIENYQEYFSSGRGARLFETIGEQTAKLQKETSVKTYEEIKNEIENNFNAMTEGIDKGSEEYKALLKLKQAEMNSIWVNDDFDLNAIIEKYRNIGNEISKAIVNILSNISIDAAKALYDIGILSGSSYMNGFINYINNNKDELGNNIIEYYNELLKSNPQEAVSYLTDQLSKYTNTIDNTNEVVGEYIAIMKKAQNITTASAQSFASWGEEIKNVAEPLKSLNNTLEELSENGSMSIDTFLNLLTVIDQLSTSLSGDDLVNFTNLLSKMDFRLDENTGNIIANSDAIEGMREIYSFMVKQKLSDMSDEMAGEIATLQAKKSMAEQELKYVEALIKMDEAEAASTAANYNSQLTAAKDNINYCTQAANAELSINEQRLSGLQKQNQAFLGNKAIPTIVIDNKKTNASATGNNTTSIGVIEDKYSGIKGDTKSLESAKSALETEIANYANQIKNLETMKATLDRLKNKDWSKYGTSSKSSTSKEIDKYISKLEELLELLTHIEEEENKLTTLESLREKQTGKANIDNLLREIELVEHLQEDYLEAFNKQKEATEKLKNTIVNMYGKIISFNEDGSININRDLYDKLDDESKEKLDDLIDQYKEATTTANGYYSKLLENTKKEIELRQEVVDKYIKAENELVDAIKSREQKILDAKLEAIDKEIEAIEKVSDARRKAREEEDDAEELSGMQIDLQRAMMDSSGASASQILSIQKQIKDKQREIADNSFDDMIDDMKQQLEDEKEAEKALFDERLEEMDWYWAEVDRIMEEGTESIMSIMQTYSDEYNQASEIQQTEMLNGWKDTFGAAEAIGKTGVINMQKIISGLRDAFNALSAEDVEAALNLLNGIGLTAESLGIKVDKVTLKAYATGGLNTTTGPAWLDGTKTNPEAVLNATQTKAFLKLTDDYAALANGDASVGNVIIDTISFNVDSMSSVEDGKIAFDTFVNEFKKIGSKAGISIKGTVNNI